MSWVWVTGLWFSDTDSFIAQPTEICGLKSAIWVLRYIRLFCIECLVNQRVVMQIKKTKTTIMQAETCHTLFIHLCHFHSWKCGKNLWPWCLHMSFKLYSNTVCISNWTLAIDRCVSHYDPSPPSWTNDQKFQSLPDTNMSLPVCSFVSCKSS